MPKATSRLLDKPRASARLWLHQHAAAVFSRFSSRASRWKWLRYIPERPYRKLPPPWPERSWDTPDELRTVAGIRRDPEAEAKAFSERPVHYFWALHPEVWKIIPYYGWSWILPCLPRRLRMQTKVAFSQAAENQPEGPPPDLDPEALTTSLRAEARRLGLSKIGFAAFDPKYVFGRRPSDGDSGKSTTIDSSTLSEGSVIVCLLEQDWKATQTIPSTKCERSVQRSYSEMMKRAFVLVDFLKERGFQAQVQGPGGHLLVHHYAVEAGLGQLGINGQLLTPEAGSRCRITLITTNATLVHGHPVDYGVHKICDECQICVKRCPPGAIPKSRRDHRGITKAKIKAERCTPIMAQAHGCAICMKVCPVQRYGLDAVTTHFVETGNILGKGSDELEGYHWLDGRHYGPGEKPRMTGELLKPLGVAVDPTRKDPPATDDGKIIPGLPGSSW